MTSYPDQYFNKLKWNQNLAIAVSRKLLHLHNQTRVNYSDSVDSAYCFVAQTLFMLIRWVF